IGLGRLRWPTKICRLWLGDYDAITKYRESPGPESNLLFFFCFFLFLNRHILQFTGLEDLSALLAFHVFGFFIARDNLNLRMLAVFGDDFLLRRLGRLARRHKLEGSSYLERECAFA